MNLQCHKELGTPKRTDIGILKRDRPSRREPPNAPGIYRFRDKATGKTEYIGETVNLRKRKKQHGDSGKLRSQHHFEWQQADSISTSKTKRRIEKEHIRKYQPTLNRDVGGSGRLARRGSGRRPQATRPDYDSTLSGLEQHPLRRRALWFSWWLFVALTVIAGVMFFALKLT